MGSERFGGSGGGSASGAPPLDQAKVQVQEVAERAQQAAGEASSRAQLKVREQVDQRSTEAGSQVVAAAEALRTSSGQLRMQGNQAAAQAADRAAEQAHRLGGYLQRADADQILADVEDLARANPWAAVVGGMVVGAAAARFLKASSSRRYDLGRPRPALGAPNGSPPPRAAP